MSSGSEGACRLMDRKNPPDAIMACTDLMAIGALRWLRRAGIRVPEQVAVMGFDNISLASLVEPGLSTVAQPIHDLGRRAAQLIIQDGGGQSERPKRVVLPCELVLRGSTEAGYTAE